jgi:hypothetical protein
VSNSTAARLATHAPTQCAHPYVRTPNNAAVALTVTSFAGFYFFSDGITDWLLDSTLGGEEFGPGDCVGALLWAASFWFTSPLQLLLLFFGDYDIERPSGEVG